jgi:hypothetical protein
MNLFDQVRDEVDRIHKRHSPNSEF